VAIPDRAQAWELLNEYTASEALVKHALAVEAGMRYYARKYGEDEEFWAVVGLLHDFDYDRYPSLDDHPFKGAEILRGRGYDEAMVKAILSHADHTGVPRDTQVARTLFAVDELAGFITAVALVRPSKKLDEVKVKSVKKKLKDKAFARNVSRDDIANGATGLDLELEMHIANVIEAMQSISNELGL